MNWSVPTPCYNYFLDVRNENYKKVHKWVAEFFNTLDIKVNISKLDSQTVNKITKELLNKTRIDGEEIIRKVKEIYPKSTLIFVKRGIKFTDPECIWGCTSSSGNFIGISKIAKEVIWHELYHKIGLGHCEKNCVMRWDTETTDLCSDCQNKLREALDEWKTDYLRKRRGMNLF